METIKLQINRLFHLGRNLTSRHRIKNSNVSIISSNCIGGVMYHDLHLPFPSPTINLFFKPDSFLNYVERIKHYNEKELVKVPGKEKYPVGKIEDVEIHFLHYSSFEKAREDWDRRKKRVNYDNIVVIMTDWEIRTKETIEAFGRLPYPKILLTNKQLEYPYCKYISGFDGQRWLGNTIEYFRWGKRYYEQFDYVKFLNNALERNINDSIRIKY